MARSTLFQEQRFYRDELGIFKFPAIRIEQEKNRLEKFRIYSLKIDAPV